jgi:hypothetical protein
MFLAMIAGELPKGKDWFAKRNGEDWTGPIREQCKMTELETNELVQGNAIQGSARHGREETRHWMRERI